MRKLKMWIAEALAVSMMFASCPADVQAAVLEPVENEASFSGDQNGVKTFPAGDNVTATFDEATATITLYSDGGTLQWDRDYLRERYDINLEEVEYIRVAEDAGTIALPAFSHHLFSGCSKLKELDLSRFDASKVSEIYYMFTGCESLESVDVSGIDTENINNLGGVFWDCKSLKSLDLSSWKLLSSEGTEPFARECFAGCESLTTIKTPLINTWDCIELPRVMYDEEDNGYSSLPKLNESITLSVKVHDYGDIVVGDGVTATFDNLTGEVILHSDGGVLWPKWIDKLNVYEDIESIRLSESSGTVYLPADSSNMFSGCEKLTNLDLSGFNSSNVTNMAGMFYDCRGLTDLDVSGLNTSKVTDMAGMFSECRGLTGLDLSNFDTSNVTDMSSMFYNCSGLTYLDLSNFDTSDVTDMSSMFYNCSGLTDLDVSGLNTSKMTDMSYMFYECRGLTSLDLSNFDTSNVTDVSSMFYNCSGLTDLDVSSLDTSNVTDMAWMFSGCRGLTGLDVSSLDTSKVTDMTGMFSGCSGLTYLDLSNFDTSNVTDMGRMFSGCSSLTGLDLSNFDTSKVTDMARMFYECSSLTYLDLSNFDTSNVPDMAEMFYECSSLTGLDLSNFDTSNVTDMAWIFRGCYALTDLDLSAFDLSSLDINHFPIQLPDNFYCLFIMRDFGFDVPEYYEALETLKTPKVNPFNWLVLPREMYDELGNAYRYLPVLSDSIQLASSKELAEERRVPASGIKLDRTEAVIKREESIKLTASVLPDTATYKVVKWESSDETIAVVSQDGLVTALKEGEADITATTVIGEHSAGCHVTVAAQGITGVRLNRSSLTLKRGDVSTLTAAVEPSYAENKSVIWSSSDETVASVDENGTITALKIGKTNITATTAEGGFTASCTIIVQKNEEFIDVADPSEWYYESVYWAVRNGVTSGMGEGTFRPTAQLSRAQTVAFLYNLAGKPDVSGLDVKDFSDVPQNAWYSKAVRWAVANKITSGYGTGTFRPNATCTRAMIVTFLANYAKAFEFYKEPSVSSNFKDVASDDWYKKSVDWALKNGITSGYGQGTFQPNKTCTRAMMVVFLKKTDALSKAA